MSATMIRAGACVVLLAVAAASTVLTIIASADAEGRGAGVALRLGGLALLCAAGSIGVWRL